MAVYDKIGYLNENFKIFHLCDSNLNDIEFHYHDFHKILIFIKGNVDYIIEGGNHRLQSMDIVFVHAGEVHKPVKLDDSEYERIVIYISKDYLNSYSKEANLENCLEQAMKKKSHVLRMADFTKSRLYGIVKELEESLLSKDFANDFYQNVLFLQFMVLLNRYSNDNEVIYVSNEKTDDKIVEITNYLNENLAKDLSIDEIANKFFVSRYHLMHIFRNKTGYTLGNYIATKRLLYANELIENGTSVTEACFASGFKNYSTFYRAYKKHFGHCASKSLDN